MHYEIEPENYESIEKKVKTEMGEAAKEAGFDGWHGKTMCFAAHASGKFVGAIIFDLIYGQMCIQYLVVAKEHRLQGIGSKLLHRALEVGVLRGCKFAYLETLSFQATDFYEKHGFVLEFSRSGYNDGIAFNYYKKQLSP